jgi:hypothetical protein
MPSKPMRQTRWRPRFVNSSISSGHGTTLNVGRDIHVPDQSHQSRRPFMNDVRLHAHPQAVRRRQGAGRCRAQARHSTVRVSQQPGQTAGAALPSPGRAGTRLLVLPLLGAEPLRPFLTRPPRRLPVRGGRTRVRRLITMSAPASSVAEKSPSRRPRTPITAVVTPAGLDARWNVRGANPVPAWPWRWMRRAVRS